MSSDAVPTVRFARSVRAARVGKRTRRRLLPVARNQIVYPADTSLSIPPLLVYLVDSLGFRAVFRPKPVSYDDGRTLRVGGAELHVPSHASFQDARGEDTLRVDIDVEDAIATDTRPRKNGAENERGDPLGSEKARPWFIQMKGTARISGRLDGQSLAGIGTGFFETYR